MSYEATAALLTAALGHPAVVCAAPLYPFWSVFDELIPGGIAQRSFVSACGLFAVAITWVLCRARLVPRRGVTQRLFVSACGLRGLASGMLCRARRVPRRSSAQRSCSSVHGPVRVWL